MSDKTQAVAVKAPTEFELQLAEYEPQFAAVLPSHIAPERFRRVILTAVSQNPDLATADRRSFFNACVKCASDGLQPDGREAALVVFNTKVKNKRTGQEGYVPMAQYLPMVAGIRKRMRNATEIHMGQVRQAVLSAEAEVVYVKDHFIYERGDNARIEHRPVVDGERGAPRGAYAIIRLANGEIIRDYMTVADIEKTRQQSRAPNSLMWTQFWGEGAKKTVLRRASKSAPSAPEVDLIMDRDDELPDPGDAGDRLPARPTRVQFTEPEPTPVFTVVDAQGEATDYTNAADAAQAFRKLLDAAEKQGQKAFTGMWETNEHLTGALRDAGHADLADALHERYTVVMAEFDKAKKAAAEKAEQKPATVASASPAGSGPVSSSSDATNAADGRSGAASSQAQPQRQAAAPEPPSPLKHPKAPWQAWQDWALAQIRSIPRAEIAPFMEKHRAELDFISANRTTSWEKFDQAIDDRREGQ